jgi:hypothetical protein
MSPLTLEWIAKAEEDFQVAQREGRARKNPSHNAACFHAQQCAEKYLKARLQLVLPLEPLWSALDSALNSLTIYGVNFRYPGANASKADARQALKDCMVVRREVRLSLGLPT